MLENKLKRTAALLILSLLTAGSTVYAQSSLKLWYKKPASQWVEALPVGNGHIGGMVFGGVEEELIQLNESTLYSGGPVKRNINLEAHTYLPQIREALLKEEDYTKANSIAKKMQGRFTESYMPLGDIKITHDFKKGIPSAYYRDLDISNAIATTKFVLNNIEYRREVFASSPGNVMVIRITSNRKGALNFDVSAQSGLRYRLSVNGSNELCVSGKAPAHVDPSYYNPKDREHIVYEDTTGCNGMRFQYRIKALPKDGKVFTDTSGIHVQNASEVILYIAAATSFNGYDKCPDRDGKDEKAITTAIIDNAMKRSYASLLKAHIEDYQKYFNRVSFTLKDTAAFNGNSELPSDERLKAYSTGAYDPALETLYFQFGRYLLIASSRPGGPPANLQGIWNKELRAPWSSNYTININTQMNYWPAEVTNLSEMHMPLLNWLRALSVTGANTAKEFYRANGWVAHHNSDIWCTSNAVGDLGAGDPVYANWYMGGNWLCQHLWEHYAYTKDKKFLADHAYPIMKEAALFTFDWLVEDKEGYLVTAPSTSPEHKFKDSNGAPQAVSVASTMDMAIIRDLFTNLIEASQVLGTDGEFRKTLIEKRKKLYPMHIGTKGQLLEWYREFEDTDPQHRHVSHLFGLYPGRELSATTTPDFYNAAKKTLELRGDVGTGWSKGWKINWWARLLDGDHAYRLIRELLKYTNTNKTDMHNGGGTYPNFFDAHPPFQIDGNFAGTAGMAEMLLQSHLDEIHLLPALPAAWSEGSIKGLKARGNFEISIQWKKGALSTATIRSIKGGMCILRTGSPITVNGVQAATQKTAHGFVTSFKTEKGKLYRVFTIQPQSNSVPGSNDQKVETCIQRGVLKVPRSKINFNGNWKFQMGDHQGAEYPGFVDDKWQNTGLPHSFSTPYFLSSDFYLGYGWYRKRFTIPAGYNNKKYFLEFEAVFQHAEVFVNNKKVGEHKGGYTGFSLDISDALQTGENVVAVRVNNVWNAGLAPRAGEHAFSGGIYRDVFLVITDPVHIDWCGTFISTPLVSEKKANVNVKTEIRNDGNTARIVKINTDIIDSMGKLVTSFSSVKKISARTLEIIDQTSSAFSNPKLWHFDHPHLYTAVTTLLVNNIVTDRCRTTFGIRSVKWTADKGFFLNGKPVYLRGANVHQDHAGWGDAVTNAGFYRDVKMMKDAGFNFIRGSHYPHDPAFVEACDKLGMLFWSENAFWGIGGSDRTPEGYWNSSAYPTQESDRNSFESSLKQQLREMIRIHRNSPSIIAWSMSNEPFFTAKQTAPAMRNLLKDLVAVSHEEDPTRVAAIGGTQRPFDDTRIDKLGDVAGYNGDGATIPAFLDPGIPSVVSEYGSTPAERPGNYEPGWGSLAKDSGKHVYAWRSGQAIWCGFDHGSIAGSRLGKMGIVDYFRIPKRAWYWYRNEYLHIPPPEWPQPGVPAKLRLVADKKSVKTDGSDDVKLLVTVLDNNDKPVSNNPTVELAIVSGPGEFPTGPSIKFEENRDISILDGQAAIECRSWYAGNTVIRATSPRLAPAAVTINFTGTKPWIKGITPATEQRPYVRYNKKDQLTVLQHFGQNNPTFGSTFNINHATAFAADGNKKTWWQPLPNDTDPYWILDTEKKLSLVSIDVTFPMEDIFRFKVEVSDDMKSWRLAADYMNNDQKIGSKKIMLAGLTGGAVRISFDNAASANLAEVDVIGKVIE